MSLSKTDLLGELTPITHVAVALDVSERSIKNTIAKFNVPSVKILGRVHVRPVEFRRIVDEAADRAAGRN